MCQKLFDMANSVDSVLWRLIKVDLSVRLLRKITGTEAFPNKKWSFGVRD